MFDEVGEKGKGQIVCEKITGNPNVWKDINGKKGVMKMMKKSALMRMMLVLMSALAISLLPQTSSHHQ